MQEIFDSIKNQLNERISSPLLSSFVISWLICNYKVPIIIMSSMKATEKIEYIEHVIFPNPSTLLANGALYPALSALFLIYIYPIPAKYVYKFHKRRLKELHDINHSIEEKKLLSAVVAGDIYKKTREIEKQYSEEINIRLEEIKEANEQIKYLMEQNKILEDQLEKASEKYKPPRVMDKDEAKARLAEMQEQLRRGDGAQFEHSPEKRRRDRTFDFSREIEDLIDSEPLFESFNHGVSIGGGSIVITMRHRVTKSKFSITLPFVDIGSDELFSERKKELLAEIPKALKEKMRQYPIT